MKTLYVSDLDGTLLNANQELGENACKKLNMLIDKGINFTVSTGRGNSVKHILQNIHFKYPIMLLNGALNYDYSKQKYMDQLSIPIKTTKELINALIGFNYKRFEIQTILNEKEVERIKVIDWNEKSEPLALNILHMTKDSNELSNILSQISGINYFIHKKVYSDGESYCDIVLENVSKASRLKIFKKQYGFDKVVAFGDSENDLPLATVADEFYAVENAVDIVKQKATGIIDSCYNDGVIKYIEQVEKHKKA